MTPKHNISTIHRIKNHLINADYSSFTQSFLTSNWVSKFVHMEMVYRESLKLSSAVL